MTNGFAILNSLLARKVMLNFNLKKKTVTMYSFGFSSKCMIALYANSAFSLTKLGLTQ